MSTINPFARPLYVMLKPAGSLCNLRCKYCYYLEKNALYTEQKNHVISDEMLDKFIREYIEAQTSPDVLFCWHGGETLMRPISFYRRAIELQRKYARGRRIDNTIQTNATMLTDEWCEFFRENNFLVGVSIDGPQEFHDEYRRTATGKPTFHKVMQGIRLLNKHNVEWNALAVVNDFNADYPLEFYNFFKEIDQSIRKKCHKLQDVNVYLIQFQTFTQDLMMLLGNLMKFKLRLPGFMKKALYTMTQKTVDDIFNKNDFNDASVVKTVMQLRQLDKQLCFSQQWVTDFAFQVLMLAKKEPRPSDEEIEKAKGKLGK